MEKIMLFKSLSERCRDNQRRGDVGKASVWEITFYKTQNDAMLEDVTW
jgi:hypothetical protein